MLVGVCGPPGSSVPIFKSLAVDLLVRLLGVSIASSKESRRTFLIPDWSQGCLCHAGWCLWTSREQCANFQVSSC